MKLWRKLSKKQEDGTRTGRSIKYQYQMMEQMSKLHKKSYPLLDALLEKAGIVYILTAKQQSTFKQMIEKQNQTEE